MAVDLEEQKKRVEQQKKKLKLKEILLREKERQRKAKRISEIIDIAFKTHIDLMEDAALYGAFLEIAEKIQLPHIVDEWRKKGESHLNAQQKEDDISNTLLAISFGSDPGKEIKESLKKMRFRWNPFRKEFCGHGNAHELETLLKSSDFTIETIE